MQLESAITLNIRGGATVLYGFVMLAYIDWDLGSDLMPIM